MHMDYGNFHSLPAQEVESWGLCSWDIESWGPLNLMSTVAESLNKDSEMESLSDSLSFKLTSETLYGTDTQTSTKAAVTSFLRAFPASPFPSPENEPEPTTQETCGPPPSQPYAQLDPVTASLKTFQACLIADISGASSLTWPKAGMACAGVVYRQPSWELRISEIGYGLLPTPTTSDTSDREPGNPILTKNGTIRHRNKAGGQSYMRLTQVVKYWATPQARDYRTGETHRWDDPNRSRNLNDQVGGQLNPNWTDWLMGFPVGWTESKPLEMHKFRLWRQQHGDY